jgi:hypothetical protein
MHRDINNPGPPTFDEEALVVGSTVQLHSQGRFVVRNLLWHGRPLCIYVVIPSQSGPSRTVHYSEQPSSANSILQQYPKPRALLLEFNSFDLVE